LPYRVTRDLPHDKTIEEIKIIEINKDKSREFVAIEGFNRNSSVLKKYQERNLFNYRFLMSTDEVTYNYNISAVPVFLYLMKIE